ncbi:MAG: chromosomal replication initiator protein DnaA [Clostridia bacterium]|nr:chromosomal replication initiator protein DnaA [Clostridia bacterium]
MIDINAFWNDAKSVLSTQIQTISYEVWIDKLEPVCFVNGALILSTLSAASKKTIEQRYLDLTKEVVSNLNPSIQNVEIIMDVQREQYLKKQDSFIEDEGFVVKEQPVLSTSNTSAFLEKYTFDHFVQGKGNEFALAAAKAVAENPGGKYNPLFIYSSVGLGKTHLLHAIGNYIKKNSPRTKVLYVNSESFINELIDVIRRSSENKELNSKFREKYRSVDVLMIDDIQFLAGKEGTQEAFFHTFNDLYQNNKQIILTSDRSPKDLQKLEERLRTRFSWGLTVDISFPDMETRIAILKSKAAQEKFNLSNDVASFIAENSTSNIRDMEGFLNKIIFFSSLTGHPVTTREIAKEALSDFIEEKKESFDASSIVATTCKYFNITSAEIIGKKKTKNIVEPRMIAIYLITEMLDLPLVTIGQIFGGRDHTTIIHARNKISEDVKNDTRIKIIVSDIKNMILNR